MKSSRSSAILFFLLASGILGACGNTSAVPRTATAQQSEEVEFDIGYQDLVDVGIISHDFLACNCDVLDNDEFQHSNVDCGVGEEDDRTCLARHRQCREDRDCATGLTCVSSALSMWALHSSEEGCYSQASFDKKEDCQVDADCTHSRSVCVEVGQPTGKCFSRYDAFILECAPDSDCD